MESGCGKPLNYCLLISTLSFKGRHLHEETTIVSSFIYFLMFLIKEFHLNNI
jgi:hypothetical protein